MTSAQAITAALFVGTFFAMCAAVAGGFLFGLAHALAWLPGFAIAILPGVLIGSRVRTWQLSVILTEISVLVVAIVVFDPDLKHAFDPPFRDELIRLHLGLFPPLLLSILIGHFGRSP